LNFAFGVLDYSYEEVPDFDDYFKFKVVTVAIIPTDTDEDREAMGLDSGWKTENGLDYEKTI